MLLFIKKGFQTTASIVMVDFNAKVRDFFYKV